ncbi:MAG: hypothetical protein ACC628_21030 [Pirellulaceae bacterium]
MERIETIYQGKIDFQQTDTGIAFSLPLGCTDYVKSTASNRVEKAETATILL